MSSCIVRLSNRTEVLQQLGKSVRFENPSRVDYDRAHVDDCLLKGRPEPKCDYFVRNDSTIWLVELKGRHVEHAIKQIVSASHLLSKEIGGREVVAVIVASRCPAISGQHKHLRELKKCFKGLPRLVLKSGSVSITI